MPQNAEEFTIGDFDRGDAVANGGSELVGLTLAQFNPSRGQLVDIKYEFGVFVDVVAGLFSSTPGGIGVQFNALSFAASDGPAFPEVDAGEVVLEGPLIELDTEDPTPYFISSSFDLAEVAPTDLDAALGTGTYEIVADVAPVFFVIDATGSVPTLDVLPEVSVTYTFTANVVTARNSLGDQYDNYVDLGAGDDIYNGKNGNDIIIGGTGDDIIRGGNGIDQASYSTSDAGVTVDLADSGADVGGGQGADTFVSIEGVRGSKFDDRIFGDDGAKNFLVGLGGADVIKGRSGEDLIEGGGGDDRLFGNGQSDLITGGNGSDELRGGSGGDILLGGSGEDTVKGGSDRDELYGGGANDVIFGNSGKDELYGDAGDDTLNGGQNKDVIMGGRGDDTMIGGSGADVFVIETGDGVDVITDFEVDRDVLDLFGTDFSGATQGETSAGYLIEFADGSSVLLEGVTASEFDDATVFLPGM